MSLRSKCCIITGGPSVGCDLTTRFLKLLENGRKLINKDDLPRVVVFLCVLGVLGTFQAIYEFWPLECILEKGRLETRSWRSASRRHFENDFVLQIRLQNHHRTTISTKFNVSLITYIFDSELIICSKVRFFHPPASVTRPLNCKIEWPYIVEWWNGGILPLQQQQHLYLCH